MAGRGSRLRPHTLTVPKPLIPVAGSPIVNQLINTIAKAIKTPIDEVAFILGDPAFFDNNLEKSLIKLASSIGAKAKIYRQLVPLGTGHALICASPSLRGPAIVAFADTLIRADLDINPKVDGIIWAKKVKNPEAYGVIEINKKNEVINLVEKPSIYISNLAAIGVYYFKNIEILKNKLETILKLNKNLGEEYQINEGITSMIQDGYKINPGSVSEWMDCGNSKITIETNTKMLKILNDEDVCLITSEFKQINSKVIPPCFIGKGCEIINSEIGPYVSIGENTKVENSKINNSLIQNNTIIKNADLSQSMIGNNVFFDKNYKSISIGDFSQLI